jgi:hypothetical protein
MLKDTSFGKAPKSARERDEILDPVKSKALMFGKNRGMFRGIEKIFAW